MYRKYQISNESSYPSLIFPKRTTFPIFIATLRLPLQEKWWESLYSKMNLPQKIFV